MIIYFYDILTWENQINTLKNFTNNKRFANTIFVFIDYLSKYLLLITTKIVINLYL